MPMRKEVNGVDGKPLYAIDEWGQPWLFAGEAPKGKWWSGGISDAEVRLIELCEHLAAGGKVTNPGKEDARSEIGKFLNAQRATTSEIHNHMVRRFGKYPKSSLWYLLQEMRKDGDLKQVTEGKSSVWMSLDF